jgi:hypothetical protein
MSDKKISIVISSRHIVIIAGLIALAAVLLPVSVQAATGSAVNITDPVTSRYKAGVTGNGILKTDICSYNSNSYTTCATVSNHSLNTVVNGGFVNAGTDIPPLFPLSKVLTISDTTSDFIGSTGDAAFVPDEEVEISAVTVTNYSAVPLQVLLQRRNQSVTCTAGGGTAGPTVEEIYAPAHQTVHLDFPQPLVVTGDGTNPFCIDAGPSGSNASGSDVRVTIVGYEF